LKPGNRLLWTLGVVISGHTCCMLERWGSLRRWC